jgi:hypothetical protein
MQRIILGLIVFLVVSLLGVSLFYIGNKFLLNVSTDVSNTSKTTSANNSPEKPTLPMLPTGPTTPLSTKPIQANTLECWSQSGYQGYITDTHDLATILPYSNSPIINIDSNTQSIRYPPGKYEIFYLISSSIPLSINDITNPLSSHTPNIIVPDNNKLFIFIKSTATTVPPAPPGYTSVNGDCALFTSLKIYNIPTFCESSDYYNNCENICNSAGAACQAYSVDNTVKMCTVFSSSALNDSVLKNSLPSNSDFKCTNMPKTGTIACTVIDPQYNVTCFMKTPPSTPCSFPII